MKYYAKTPVKGDRSTASKKFLQSGIPNEKVIFDSDKQQKKPDSTYTKLKGELEQSHEPLCIDSLFSLGRNAKEITKEIGWFREHGIDLSVLDIPASMVKFDGKMDLLFEINEVYAQREINNLKAGQKASLKKRKKTGGTIGRPPMPYPKNWEELYGKYEKGEISSSDFIEQTGLTRGTFYNMSRRYLQERRQIKRTENKKVRSINA